MSEQIGKLNNKKVETIFKKNQIEIIKLKIIIFEIKIYQ